MNVLITKRVSRLKIGDWILIAHFASPPKFKQVKGINKGPGGRMIISLAHSGTGWYQEHDVLLSKRDTVLLLSMDADLVPVSPFV